MIDIRNFIRSDAELSDNELALMVKEGLLKIPVAEQPNWILQVDLSLDRYRHDPERQKAQRVKAVLRQLDADMNDTTRAYTA